MLDNKLHQLIFLLIFKFLIETFTLYLDYGIGLGEKLIVIINIGLSLIPFLILSFIEVNKRCKNKPFISKLNKSINDGIIKYSAGSTYKMAAQFIPILGDILSLFDFIPVVSKLIDVVVSFSMMMLFDKMSDNPRNKDLKDFKINYYCGDVGIVQRIISIFLFISSSFINIGFFDNI
jgi:hypothetical protein